jgi:hypothetical protein
LEAEQAGSLQASVSVSVSCGTAGRWHRPASLQAASTEAQRQRYTGRETEQRSDIGTERCRHAHTFRFTRVNTPRHGRVGSLATDFYDWLAAASPCKCTQSEKATDHKVCAHKKPRTRKPVCTRDSTSERVHSVSDKYGNASSGKPASSHDRHWHIHRQASRKSFAYCMALAGSDPASRLPGPSYKHTSGA